VATSARRGDRRARWVQCPTQVWLQAHRGESRLSMSDRNRVQVVNILLTQQVPKSCTHCGSVRSSANHLVEQDLLATLGSPAFMHAFGCI
jgi:hypothetical protein